MNDLLETADNPVVADPGPEKTQEIAKAQAPGAVQAAPEISMGMMIESLTALASNPDVDVEKMSRIMDLQERMMDKDAEMQFNKAMAKMQAVMPVIKKDGSVEYAADKNDPNSKMVKAFDYASFENIMKIVKPILSEHGFAITFDSDERQTQGGGAVIKALLLHEAGHSKTTSFAAALDSSGGKNNIQAMGSTFSYGKRYCVTALLNIITEGEDDDGNKAFLEAPIDDAQFEEIQRLITETDTDTARFCGHLKITSLRDMPQRMYAKAAHDLKAKAKKIAEKAAQEGGAS